MEPRPILLPIVTFHYAVPQAVNLYCKLCPCYRHSPVLGHPVGAGYRLSAQIKAGVSNWGPHDSQGSTLGARSIGLIRIRMTNPLLESVFDSAQLHLDE